MKRVGTFLVCSVMWCLPAGPPALGQQGGFGGGGFGGGMGGMAAGPASETAARTARAVDNRLGRYLRGDEVSSILTPGEHVEFVLPVKAGQVVLAEARSDAFDPALEVVDEAAKVLAANDDRYPGDQRPLLLWECPRDGSYKLYVRCFRDKAGGRLYARSVVLDAVDLASGQMVERSFDKPGSFLLRVPMKAGQIKQVVVEAPDAARYVWPQYVETISPTGLPDARLQAGIERALPSVLVAPVAGTYYVVESLGHLDGARTVRVGTRDVVPVTPPRVDGAYTAKADSGARLLMAVPVKAGDLLAQTAPDLGINATIDVAEAPDFAAFDVSKDTANPFFPTVDGSGARKESALTMLPGRARDSRISVFHAGRDATIWVATQAASAKAGQYTLTVRPAARSLPDGAASAGKLAIGSSDYFSFEATAGDVMTVRIHTASFAAQAIAYDPDMQEVWEAVAPLDQADVETRLIARKPGRYVLVVSALGDGGAGAYSVTRKTSPPRTLTKAQPAVGEVADGATHVWRLTAKPGEPVLVHWKSTGALQSTICDDHGVPTTLPLTMVAAQDHFGILSVAKPITYLIVLTSAGGKAGYTIDLADIPGHTHKQ